MPFGKQDIEQEQPAIQSGTVTDLKRQRKIPTRISVYVDGAFAFGASERILAERRIRKGDPVSAEVQQSIISADRLLRAEEKAVQFLAYRARTVQEVASKLMRSGFAQEEATEVAERLRSIGYLDDEAFAKEYVSARIRVKQYGPARIKRELMQKGVDRHLIEAVIGDTYSEEAIRSAAENHARKRWAQLSGESDERKRKKKVFDYLVRRGFDPESARTAVKFLN